jgi:Mg-chelatase subunit ChlD
VFPWHRVLLLAALIGCAGTDAAAQGLLQPSDPLEEWPRDPVYVFYPRDSCRGDQIELEVWSRRANDWVPHPVHPRVPVESCQLEDAGVLWNELRRRCIEPVGGLDPPSWIVGLDVFDETLTSPCAVAHDEGAQPMTIEVASPNADVPLRAAEPVATVRGHVLLDGRHGAAYDAVIAIDTSPSEDGDDRLLRAQVAAARSFIHRARPRLGDVRIGLVTFPGRDAGLPLGRDADALDRALQRIARAGTGEAADLGAGIARGLDALGSNARPGARHRLLLATDGRRDLPFGPDERQPAAARSRLAELARTLDERGVELHLYALGGLAAEPSPLVRELTASARSRYSMVAEPGAASGYLLDSRMPYVTWVDIHNRTTGERAESVRYGSSGDFEAELPVAFGPNELVIEARSSANERVEIAHAFEFDGSLVRERLLEVERDRMERLRREREVIVEPAAHDDRRGG